MLIDMTIEAAGWSRIGDLETLVRRAVDAAANVAGEGPGGGVRDDTELSVLLADDATVRRLNRDYRGIDKPTNVLSFPQHEAADAQLAGMPCLIGDIVLALETVEREAAEAGKPVEDHLTHLIVHGLLHLCGYDHETDEEAEAMEARERAILASLGISDPYAADQPLDPAHMS